MSEDERIERLTALARRVTEWAHRKGIAVELEATGAAVRFDGPFPLFTLGGSVDGPPTRLDLLAIYHPRALDALEKALEVLAGEDGKT